MSFDFSFSPIENDRPNVSAALRSAVKAQVSFGGPALRLSGTLVGLFDGRFRGDGPMVGGLELSFGPSAVLRAPGATVLVVTYPIQMFDLQQFRSFGIDPAKHRVVALKSAQHFRAAFAPIAGQIVVCDGTDLRPRSSADFPIATCRVRYTR